MSDIGLNEGKRRTIQVKAFEAPLARIGRDITAEILTGSSLGVPWSPWLFAPDFEVRDQEVIDRDSVLGLPARWTADGYHLKSRI